MPKFSVTPFECALLSRLAYQGHRQKDKKAIENSTRPDGWHLLSDHHRSAGFSATLSCSAAKNSLVYAVRGTENLANLKTDLVDLMQGNHEAILAFVTHGKEIVSRMLADEAGLRRAGLSDGFTLVVTGHSLGGFLAGLTMFSMINDGIISNDRVEAMVFDAPGIGGFYNPEQSIGEGSYDGDINLLTNYISQQNYVNTCQPHLGHLIQLAFPDYPPKDPQGQADAEAANERNRSFAGASTMCVATASAASGMVVSPIVLLALKIFGMSALDSLDKTLYYHSIDHIILSLNPRTGFPYDSSVLHDYPQLQANLISEGIFSTLNVFELPSRDVMQMNNEASMLLHNDPSRDVNLSQQGSLNQNVLLDPMSMTPHLLSLLFSLSAYDFTTAANTLLIFAAFYLMANANNVTSSRSAVVNQAGQLIVCNQSFQEKHRRSLVDIKRHRSELFHQHRALSDYSLNFAQIVITNHAHFIPLLIVQGASLIGYPFGLSVGMTYLVGVAAIMAPLCKDAWLTRQLSEEIRSLYERSSNIVQKLRLFHPKYESFDDLINASSP